MTMIATKFIEGATGGKRWAAITHVTTPASFSPSIETGQEIDIYAEEAMEPYFVRGGNVTVNIEEAIKVVTDNDSASYFIRDQ